MNLPSNFTDRARAVMIFANEEAQRFNHEFIRPVHILLGLFKEGHGLGARVIKDTDVSLRKMRLEVERLTKSRPNMIMEKKLRLALDTGRVIDRAIANARKFHHKRVGTEHLAIGLLENCDKLTAQVLKNLGLKPADLLKRAMNIFKPSKMKPADLLEETQKIIEQIKKLPRFKR